MWVARGVIPPSPQRKGSRAKALAGLGAAPQNPMPQHLRQSERTARRAMRRAPAAQCLGFAPNQSPLAAAKRVKGESPCGAWGSAPKPHAAASMPKRANSPKGDEASASGAGLGFSAKPSPPSPQRKGSRAKALAGLGAVPQNPVPQHPCQSERTARRAMRRAPVAQCLGLATLRRGVGTSPRLFLCSDAPCASVFKRGVARA